MKAAVLIKTGQPLKIFSDVEVPTTQYGQLKVRLGYSGVCHSQLMEVRGHRGEDKWVPHLLGHEGVGIVEEVGEGVSRFRAGDRVILGWIKGDGCSVGGSTYKKDDLIINSGPVTTFSETTLVSEDRCTLLPDYLPPDLAVLFGCALPTGAGLLINEVKPKDNTTIAIIGLGGIGLSALIACRAYNFKKIIAIDISEKKLKLAHSLGASEVINGKGSDIKEMVLKHTNNLGVDYCVEAAGSTKTIELGFSILNPKSGLLVFASHPKHGDKIAIDPHELISGKQIRGSWGGGCRPSEDLPRFFKLYQSGNLPLNEIVDKRYSLDELNLALDDLEKGNVNRPIIEINPSIFC